MDYDDNNNNKSKPQKERKKTNIVVVVYDISILQGLFMPIQCLVLPIKTKVK